MTQPTLGILSAIPAELSHFRDGFAEQDRVEIAGYQIRRGLLDGQPVATVQAGIGKVPAAMVATLLVRDLGCRALVFSGVAGGLDPALGVGDVVIADRLICHDYGAMVDGALKTYQPGVPPLPGMEGSLGYPLPAPLRAQIEAAIADLTLPDLSAQATGDVARKPTISFGTIITGDSFVNCAATRVRLHTEFDAVAVEMEGAALAQAAERLGVPVVVVRALSDLAGAESHMDFQSFVGEAAGMAATIVRRLLPVVASFSTGISDTTL